MNEITMTDVASDALSNNTLGLEFEPSATPQKQVDKMVIIMRGLPGSGKSYWVEQFLKSQPIDVSIAIRQRGLFSTDQLFMVNGEYQFNSKKLPEYHQRNLTLFIHALACGEPIVICDNTNLAHWEFMAYDAAARALGYPVRLVLIGDPAEKDHQILCAKRNRHGVSFDAISRMAKMFEA